MWGVLAHGPELGEGFERTEYWLCYLEGGFYEVVRVGWEHLS